MPYQITKQDTAGDYRYYPHGWTSPAAGEPRRIHYRTKAAAEAAMRAMVPGGEDPLVYAGLRVEQCVPSDYAALVDA